MEPKQYTPEEIAKRISEVAPEKRNVELMTIAKEMGLKHEPNAEGVAVELSDAQFDRLFTGFQTEAQKVITEVAGQAERKYDLTRGDALAAAESVVGKALQKRALKRKEDEIIAKRLASIVKTRAGFAKAGEYERALDEEVTFVRDHYGVEHRAMTLGDDTTGGYLAGEVFDTRVYENLKKTSVARRFCTLMEMTGVELKRFPKLTQGLTANGKTETGAGSTSQITLSQFTLQPKQLMVLSAPFSLALLEAADPNLIDLLTKQATIAFGRAEDAALWNGNSDVGITGIMSTTTNNVTMGTGKTAITDIAFEDLFDMENELDEQYTPDEETQGSGGIDGQAFYHFNKNAYNALRKLKGDDQYHLDVQTMIRDKQIQGYKFKRIVDLPSAPAVSTRFGMFGNLGYVYMAHRNGIRTDMLKEGIVGGVNLGTTGQYAMRWIEFVDFALVDDEALSFLKTAAA